MDMANMRYSVACENDDIEDFATKRSTLAYAKQQASLGRKDIVVNVTTGDGDYIDAIHVA